MKLIKLKLLVIAAIMFAASAASASLSTYAVSIDTSSLIGTTGALDFQLSQWNGSAATAGISGFTGGTLITDPAPQISGDVGGMLPSTVTIKNTTGYNDYFTNFTFGKSINFNLSLSGAQANTFSFSMFSDVAGSTPALTSDATEGYAFKVDITDAGNTITNNITSTSEVTPTPIPAAAWLLGSGLLGLVGMSRKNKTA